jgi:hypothetical protein
MNLVLPVLFIIALQIGIVSVALTTYHFFRMTREVKSRSNWWVSLIPYIGLALPGALTPTGESHRSKAGRWLMLSGVCTLVAAGAQLLAGRL